jgi:hypothetical protein
MRKTILSSLVIGMTLVGTIDSVNAQMQFAPKTASTVASANDLEAKAAALYSTPKRYREAARLLMEAAGLREAGDPQRVKNLRQAGRLFYYTGNPESARAAMEQAADAALAVGDVKIAAEAYLDAAFLAQSVKSTAEVRRFIEKARLLTNSPLLSAEEKVIILERINAAA